jgi:hypothetical protein
MTTPMPPQGDRGSMIVGFLIAWAVLIVGHVALWAVFFVGQGFDGSMSGVATLALGALPWVGIVALIVYFAVVGKPRTAAGVALGLASMVALLLLLIAACFALFASGGWH